MARVARTASVIVALLGALALVPSMAHAAVTGQDRGVFPAEVTVGDTGLPGSLILTNDNNGTEFFSANNVCNVGSGSPCDGMRGISLIPSVHDLGGNLQDADAGRLRHRLDRDRNRGRLRARTVFSVTDLPGALGEVLFTPTAPAAS